MSASQNKKKTLSLGLALIPVISMLLLLIIGYGIMGYVSILIAAFFLTSVVSVCTGTSWGSAGTVGVALMGVAAGLDVSLAAAAGAVVSGAYFGDKISPLSDSTNFAAIVADTTLFEHIQHLLWTTLPSFLLAAVVYLIAGHSNMLGRGGYAAARYGHHPLAGVAIPF